MKGVKTDKESMKRKRRKLRMKEKKEMMKNNNSIHDIEGLGPDFLRHELYALNQIIVYGSPEMRMEFEKAFRAEDCKDSSYVHSRSYRLNSLFPTPPEVMDDKEKRHEWREKNWGTSIDIFVVPPIVFDRNKHEKLLPGDVYCFYSLGSPAKEWVKWIEQHWPQLNFSSSFLTYDDGVYSIDCPIDFSKEDCSFKLSASAESSLKEIKAYNSFVNSFFKCNVDHYLVKHETIEVKNRKRKQIQCMYCGVYSTNTNHVCDECEAAGKELAKKLEGETNNEEQDDGSRFTNGNDTDRL